MLFGIVTVGSRSFIGRQQGDLTTTLFAALGAQALNYYRYGEKKDCSEKWEDFKFCLTTKTKSNEVADVRGYMYACIERMMLTEMSSPCFF